MTTHREAIRSAQHELLRISLERDHNDPDRVTLNRVVRLLEELGHSLEVRAAMVEDLEEQLRGARAALAATPRSVYGRTL